MQFYFENGGKNVTQYFIVNKTKITLYDPGVKKRKSNGHMSNTQTVSESVASTQNE